MPVLDQSRSLHSLASKFASLRRGVRASVVASFKPLASKDSSFKALGAQRPYYIRLLGYFAAKGTGS